MQDLGTFVFGLGGSEKAPNKDPTVPNTIGKMDSVLWAWTERLLQIDEDDVRRAC